MSKSPSSSPEFSVREFFKRFPDDDACLAHVMEQRYGFEGFCPHCGVETTFHRLQNRKAYAGAACGCNIYPCAGTIFQDSKTPLQSWYYAIYLFVTTRHGVSGKELQRTLGVTYKCAYRIGQQIRKLMSKANSFEALRGHIEIDETFVGGYSPVSDGKVNKGKTIVLGMKKRGGRLVTEIIPDRSEASIKPVVLETVEEGAVVSTDQWGGYRLLERYGYEHGAVNHDKEWTNGPHHTNNLESFWALFKNSVRSTHIHVSPKHMQKYLDEFTFRSNHRQRVNLMFDLIVSAI